MEPAHAARVDGYEFGFLLEQALGHVTHAKNLVANVSLDPDVRPHWGLIDFEVSGAAARIPFYGSNWTIRAGVRANRHLARMNRERRLDALFFHTQVPAILAQRWMRRIPSIVSLDATPLQYDELGVFYKHEKDPPVLEALKWRVNRECFMTARQLVTWSEWTKSGLVKGYRVPAERIHVIPPGVDVDAWRRPVPRSAGSEPVKILFVGGDLERKGGMLLLEAFRSLRHLGLELHMVTKARLQPEQGVFVYSDLEANSEPLKALYHACDVFALPTFGDTFAMVLSEAAAAGMAIISTDVAALPEFVRDGETGLVVPVGDKGALARALRELAENPELRLALGSRAMAHAHQHHNSRTNAMRLLSLLKSEVEGQRAKTRRDADTSGEQPSNPERAVLASVSRKGTPDGVVSAASGAPLSRGSQGGPLMSASSRRPASAAAYEIAFILEQSLGHVTHAKNLQTNIVRDADVHPHWGLINFEAEGIARNLPVYRSNWTVRAGVRAYREVGRMTAEVPLDVLFFHTQVPAVFAQPWMHRIPSIVSLDATPLQYDELGAFYKHEKGAAWLESLKWRLNRGCFAAARRLVAWSEWTKRGLIEGYDVPAEKIEVISPGVNVDAWHRPTPRRAANDGPLKVLFVGGDLERKGGAVLLEAFRAVQSEGFELHLVTKDSVPAGPGIFVYNNLQANSQPLKDLYHQCDVFALPTLADCLPMVLSEAGAAGMAIISTDLAAIPEFVRHGETGMIVQAADAGSLVRSFRDLAANPDLRISLGKGAEQHARRHYDAPTNASRLLDLLKAEADRERGRHDGRRRLA